MINDLIETVNKFVAEKRVERKALMVSRGFIDSSVDYTDKLWDEFKTFRLHKWIKDNK